MNRWSAVAIVGAGPYGLSIAAHLRAAGIEYRIFGDPMHTWRHEMPDGMLLKSDGFASNLSDPKATFTLQQFCEATGTAYDHTRIPVSIDTFRSYGLAFQNRMVPDLENKQVVRIERNRDAYRLWLDDGGVATARNVVLAVGISNFRYIPPLLSSLPNELVSHASAHQNFGKFRGRRVTVIGGGASAVDISVLLKESGADVTVVSRRPIRVNDPPSSARRSIWANLRALSSPLGPGWTARFYSDAPGLIHRLPYALRRRMIDEQLASPSAGWPMKDRFVGNVPTLEGYALKGAEVRGGLVHLALAGQSEIVEHAANHVIAATGYRVSLRRLQFLDEDIRSRIYSRAQVPMLSNEFESSVDGLYFVGIASMDSFGPLMRFACGADWTARKISRKLAKLGPCVKP